jgi:hypothetical protein
VKIIYDDRFPDNPWWVVWSIKPGERASDPVVVRRYHDMWKRAKEWATEAGIFMCGRSIYHLDTNYRYIGFKDEGDALSFIILFSGQG